LINMTYTTCILKTHQSIFIYLFEISTFTSFLNIQKSSFFHSFEMTLTVLQNIELFFILLLWMILNILLFNWDSFPHINLFIVSCLQASSLSQLQITKLIEIGRVVRWEICALIRNVYNITIIIFFIVIIFNKIWNIIFILIFNFINIIILWLKCMLLNLFLDWNDIIIFLRNRMVVIIKFLYKIISPLIIFLV
jgi:hypothetical protein